MTLPSNEAVLDTLVVGGGPAGLQAAYLLEQRKRHYVLLEASEEVGAFFRHFPRSGHLVSFNKRYSIYHDPEINLRWDWNSLLTEDYSFPFAQFSDRIFPTSEEMARYLRSFAQHFALNVRCQAPVTSISRQDDGTFRIEAAGESYRARSVIVASGLQIPHIPEIPGIEYAVGYENASFCPKDYAGKRVLIIGKGNSGFELADALLPTASLIHIASPSPVQLSWNTKHSGHVRAQYTRILDAYQLKTLHSSLDCQVLEIEKQGSELAARVRYSHAEDESEVLVYDAIVRATGFVFDHSIFAESAAQDTMLGGRFPAMNSYWESTRTPGIFFAGTMMQARDFKKTSSAFIGGFRYNTRSMVMLLEERLHGVARPSQLLPQGGEALEKLLVERISRASSLWIQFGYLGDALFVDRDAKHLQYFFDLPVERVHEEERFHNGEVLVLTYEYGDVDGDVFAVSRKPRADAAADSAFLHPVLRFYRQGQLVEEHHLLEDLLGCYSGDWESGASQERFGKDLVRYHEESHLAPLRAFLARCLGMAAAAERCGRPGLEELRGSQNSALKVSEA